MGSANGEILPCFDAPELPRYGLIYLPITRNCPCYFLLFSSTASVEQKRSNRGVGSFPTDLSFRLPWNFLGIFFHRKKERKKLYVSDRLFIFFSFPRRKNIYNFELDFRPHSRSYGLNESSTNARNVEV